MIKKGNFLLMELSEFRAWLDSQVITRTISKIQFHHTYSPNYSTRVPQVASGKDEFYCLEGMRNTHINSNKWSATGQNITILENGKVAISLDRDLNQTPAGIKGQNTGQLCIENLGNFDKGGDTMTAKQREAIIHVYACLAKKLNLSVDTTHFVYHAWYTADGDRLADYTPGKSSKTCPGTNFFGVGNTVASAKNYVFPLIQAELDRLNKKTEKDDSPMTAAEQKEFDELKNLVKTQAKTIVDLQNANAPIEPPSWAIPAAKYFNSYMNPDKPGTTQTGTYDFWRTLTIQYRVATGNTVNKGAFVEPK